MYICGDVLECFTTLWKFTWNQSKRVVQKLVIEIQCMLTMTNHCPASQACLNMTISGKAKMLYVIIGDELQCMVFREEVHNEALGLAVEGQWINGLTVFVLLL